jgi:hypothetical protein
MSRSLRLALALAVLLVGSAVSAAAQTTGTISGSVQNEKGEAIPGATVTVRQVETNISQTAQTGDQGTYRFPNLPVGAYEVTVEASGFAKYVQSGITLALNQDAVVDVGMKVGGVNEVVNVVENAALLNTTTAEVGTRFDQRRLAELPLATNRNVYNVALSAAGVSQLQSNQSGFTNGINYSANGGRLRSNNFLIDGQDNNDFGVAGAAIALNNPDLIQEVRLVTNQFSAEFGRNSSSIFNAITKSGSNEYHGSGFWFHNDNALNACSNLNKAAGFCNPSATDPSRTKAPFRIENQLGGTIGGPLHLPRFGEGGRSIISGKDRTFFFFSIQRWWDRRLGQGVSVDGVPTEAGRAVLQQQAGNRAQVRALLDFLPPAQTALNTSESFTIGGQSFPVALGRLTGSSSFIFDDWQTSFRVDHRFSDKHTLNARYIYQDGNTSGAGQSTPPGYESSNVSRSQGVNLVLASVLSPRVVNEARAAFLRAASATVAADLRAEAIPSIQITSLNLQGLNAGATRTAIGLAANLPQDSIRNTYQLQDNVSISTGNHSFKFGADIRRQQLHQLFKPTTRGHLVYANLNNFVNDLGNVQINRDLPGVARVLHLDWHDFYFYGQDEWKIRPNFTLTLGLRYENAGQPIQDLVDFNAPVLAAAGGDERFRVRPIPGRDSNNLEPRLGFNWNPRTREGGPLGWLTGGDRLVIRGGYSRTHDYAYTNIALNIWSSFPFVAAFNQTNVAGAFANLFNLPVNPANFTRTTVTEDFDSPTYDSFSLEMQRELSRDLVVRLGYVGSKGSGLFESIDGNPVVFRTDPANSALNPPVRTDPTTGPVRLRANSGNSIYHSMQASMEKRLSRGFSGGVHFTWSTFIDTMSEIFNNSGSEIALAQDPYNRALDRGRSSYDRPLRLSGNVVYELPWFQEQRGFVGHVLGGWQFNTFFTFQSGAPFSPLNGSDPTGTLGGLASAVGIATRPNAFIDVNASRRSMEELYAIDQQLRAQAVAQAQAIFASIGGAASAPAGPLPGTLPLTLFAAPSGRVVVAANGTRSVVVDFNGLLPGQRAGTAGRNILRADGIGNVDFGILKNTNLGENRRLQLRADFFNLTNTRNFGTPASTVTGGTNFLNQWATDGGNRRVIVGIRYVF